MCGGGVPFFTRQLGGSMFLEMLSEGICTETCVLYLFLSLHISRDVVGQEEDSLQCRNSLHCG